jgi:hypothetical protein
MAIFTIYVAQDGPRTALAADQVRIVSDRFAILALLLGPIWLAYHRLWWWLGAYVIALALVYLGSHELHLPVATTVLVLVLIGLFLGLESPALQDYGLSRRGYRVADLVSAPSREAAEREFFRHWSTAAPSLGVGRLTMRGPGGDDDQIIGMFPNAGGI